MWTWNQCSDHHLRNCHTFSRLKVSLNSHFMSGSIMSITKSTTRQLCGFAPDSEEAFCDLDILGDTW